MVALDQPGGFATPRADIEVRYAGFWIRLLAYLIDGICTYAITFLAGFIFGILYGLLALAAGSKSDHVIASVLGGVAGMLVAFGYNIYFNSGRWQATPGKRLLGLHIITTNGEPVSAGLAFGRFLAYLISSLTLLIGFAMIGWTQEKKGLHDIICGTRVVYGKL